jgi:hypothetical protein
MTIPARIQQMPPSCIRVTCSCKTRYEQAITTGSSIDPRIEAREKPIFGIPMAKR